MLTEDSLLVVGVPRAVMLPDGGVSPRLVMLPCKGDPVHTHKTRCTNTESICDAVMWSEALARQLL